MRRITDGIYRHRNVDIIKDEQGIWTSEWPYLFKSYNDARNFIDKILDGTNKKEPVIVGEWQYKPKEKQ